MDNLTPITREEILMNDEPLTPITREEKILAGEDLTPVTRREYFLKKYRHAGGDVMVEELSVTENGTYTAPEGKAYSPVEVAVPMPENAYLLKTASGSLVSFDDGADLPMPSFICNIDAEQDLHGQDAPWVGGAGKNKLPLVLANIKSANTSGTWNENVYTIGGGTFEILVDNADNVVGVNVNGTFTSTAQFILFIKSGSPYPFENTNYTLSGCASGGSSTTYKLDVIYNSSGVSSILATDFGGSASADFSALSNADQMQIRIVVYSGTHSNKMFYPMIHLATEQDATFAPYSNICPISGHTGLDAVISPTTEASAGTTYSVSWQTEAGEVFGGYVDLVSGELVADRLYFEISNFDSWVYQEFNNFKALYNNLSDLGYPPIKNTRDKKVISDKFKYIYEGAYQPFGVFSIYSNGIIYFWNNDNAYANKNEMITAMNSIKPSVCYELRTPITYQLTPTQIKTLLGNNNAWCSTGDVDIGYFAKEV